MIKFQVEADLQLQLSPISALSQPMELLIQMMQQEEELENKRATTNLSGKGTSGGALLTTESADAVLRPQPPPQMQVRTSLQASPHKDQQFPQPSRGSAINGALAGAGVAGAGVAGAGVAGAGIAGAGVAGAGVAGADVAGAGVAGAGRRKRAPTARNELVRKVMKEQGLSLPLASAYIKKTDYNINKTLSK